MSSEPWKTDLRYGGMSDRAAKASWLAEQNQKPRERLVPIPWSKIHSLPRREPVVSGLLDRAAMSVVFGGSNTGKTFWTLDLSASVALGQEWRGRKVRQGAVIYIAAEGGLGIEERLTAYRIHHGVEADGVPLYVIPEPIDLCKSQADIDLLLKRLKELPSEPHIELIVVDTLSRALAGGNENGADDMGAFVRHCDRLRMETKAHVLIIHHAGKDEARGARGHSLLRAATDTEIEVTKNDVSGIATAEVVKQRDKPSGDKFSFALEPIDVGQDDEGQTVTSCAVVDAESSPAKQGKTTTLPKAAQIALRALAEAVDECGQPAPLLPQIPSGARTVSQEQWRDQAYRRGISISQGESGKRMAFKRASEQLIGTNRVGIWDTHVWIAA